MKSARIWSFSVPYFPAFGLNTGRYSVSFRIQSEWGKIRTRKTPNMDIFQALLEIHELLWPVKQTKHFFLKQKENRSSLCKSSRPPNIGKKLRVVSVGDTIRTAYLNIHEGKYLFKVQRL